MLPEGQEVLIGAITDPTFGPVVTFGLGGILVEVLRDVTFRLAPTSTDDALAMVDGIQHGRGAARACAAGRASTARRSPT